MANLPYRITAEDKDELKYQVYLLIRDIFEEKIGGADLGDVFSMSGDVLVFNIHEEGGLQKIDNMLSIKNKIGGGIETIGNAGLAVKLGNSTLEADSSGLKVINASGFMAGIVTLPIGYVGVEVYEPNVQADSQILLTAKARIDRGFTSELWIDSIIPNDSFIIMSNNGAVRNVPISWMICNS